MGLFHIPTNRRTQPRRFYLEGDVEVCSGFGFFVQMAYQLLWVIQCQSHTCRTAAVILFNP